MAADVPAPAFEAYAAESVPQASPGAPGKDGRLELHFARGEGGTHLVKDFARAPFHLSGTLDTDPIDDAATVSVQSPSGGIAQGDRREVTVTVGPDATARVATGSATKVFSMERNYAQADVSLSVGSGGHLDYVPEPTILHPDARYCQSTTLDVAADATAVVGDVVVPGRLARGEAFDFDRYLSRTRICGPDGLLARDATHLQPDGQAPDAAGVLGEFRVCGTLYVVAPDRDAGALSEDLHGHVAECSAKTGATALPNDAGVLVRALAVDTEPVRVALRTAWDGARRTLLDAPAPRRRA